MPYINCDGRYTVVDSKIYTFDKSHPNYDKLVAAVEADDIESLKSHISIPEKVVEWSIGNFTYTNGSIKWFTYSLPDVMVRVILNIIEAGSDCKPILNFLEKLYQNPSSHAVKGLYDWMQHGDLRIHEDGDFLAYKYVSKSDREFTDALGRPVKEGDFVDSYSKTYRNNIGDINTMPRMLVDDDRKEGCSDGFHVGTRRYVQNKPYILVCKVNPKDVVSIPYDCDCQKIRCCSYEVISLLGE